MRILDLQLRAFGPFTDVMLDMDVGQGLYVIFGPNEAGKSSALRALKALLYGIPHNSSDNFIHENSRLRIGSRLRHSDGSELAFLRRKGNKDTLLGLDEKPIDDIVLDRFIQGVGEQLFSRFFGIDHEALICGGEDILKGGGEVGGSLFAAGLGGVSLRNVVQDLDAESESLFRQRGQNQVINRAINEYGEAKRLISEFSISSRKWAELDEALKNDIEKRANLTSELQRVDGERNHLDRLQQALPKIAKREDLLARQRELGDVVLLSPEFTDNRREAIRELKSARGTLQENGLDLEQLNTKVDELEVPEPILDQAEAITELHQRLGSHQKAARDLLARQGELHQLEADAQALLSELWPDLTLKQAEKRRLSAAQRIRIQDLGSQYQTLANNFKRAKQDIQSTERELGDVMRELDELSCPRDPSELRRTVVRIRKNGDLEGNRETALLELGAEEQQAQVELKRLGLWLGTIEELESLPIPAQETIERFENEFQENSNHRNAIQERINEAMIELQELNRKIEELRMAGAVPSEEELGGARERRDQGWGFVRREWLNDDNIDEEKRAYDSENDLAEAYERAVGYADELADRLRREADRVANNAALATRQAKCLENLQTLEEDRIRVLNEVQQVQQEWATLWQPMQIDPLPPKEMRSWVANERNLMQRSERIRHYQRNLQQLSDRIEAYRAELSRGLVLMGESAFIDAQALGALLELSQSLVEVIEESNRRRKELEKKTVALRDDLDRSGQIKGQCVAEIEQWQVDWTAVVVDLGLTEKSSPAEANAVLSKLEDLFRKLDDAEKLRHRIHGIKEDAREFATDVSGLTQRLAPHLAEMPPAQAAAQLHADLGKAREAVVELSGLRKQIQKNEGIIRDAEGTIRCMTSRLGELCQQAHCSSHDDLEAADNRSSQFRNLQNDIDTLNEQLGDLVGGGTVEQLLREVEGVDADSLPVQISEVSREAEDIQAERDQLDKRIWNIERDLHQMDGSAKAAEAAEISQSILAAIRANVDRYVRLRMASLILRREIERYRAENQGQLLSRASQLFSHLTLGSFPELRTDFNDKDEPIILGVRSTGERVGVAGMSDGTRDQLYLALRLASLEKYLETNEPMPFIVDDILIRFDDRRAVAALNVLAELSSKTQVIFFTHHSRLVELAKGAVSDRQLQICSLGG